jgi:hypothetical protein
MLDVLILALILFLAAILIRRSKRPRLLGLARLVFVILVFLLLLNLPLRMLLNPTQVFVLFRWESTNTIISWLVVLLISVSWVAIVALVHSFIFHRERATKIATFVLQITAPMILVTFSQGIAQWFHYHSGNEFRSASATAKFHNSGPRPRILWIVFDELDYNLSFIQRPVNINLPSFDRLRNESLFAENAYPPAGDTVLSLPALVTGRLVARSVRTAPNELMLTYANEDEAVQWSTQPNVFTKAQTLGMNTALVGWDHPYCRIIGASLTQCEWETASSWFLGQTEITNLISHCENVRLPVAMVAVAKTLLFPQLLHLLLPRDRGDVWRAFSIEEFENIHQEGLKFAADPNLDLILLHYPIPHPPGIYDPNSGALSPNAGPTYEDNLMLADTVLKELREKLEVTGLWDNTSIIISSDHPLRGARVWRTHPLLRSLHTSVDPNVTNSVYDPRVPFLVKLSGNTTPLSYSRSFNTVLTAHLIVAILKGEVTTTSQAASWLDSHPTIAESPFTDVNPTSGH